MRDAAVSDKRGRMLRQAKSIAAVAPSSFAFHGFYFAAYFWRR